jgi:hypothetical protein
MHCAMLSTAMLSCVYECMPGYLTFAHGSNTVMLFIVLTVVVSVVVAVVY